jgi:DNA-directed RNA polymerase subunit RPC12/RpoP
MTEYPCEVCGKIVEHVYPDEKHMLCEECAESHYNEGFAP